MKRFLSVVLTIACLVTAIPLAFSSSAATYKEVGDVNLLDIGLKDFVAIDGVIDTTNEVWGKLEPTTLDVTNMVPSWIYRAVIHTSTEIRFAYSAAGIYVGAVTFDDSPVRSSGDDFCDIYTTASEWKPEHGFNGDTLILQFDPKQAMTYSNYSSVTAPWYCFTIMEDGNAAIRRTHVVSGQYEDLTDQISLIGTVNGKNYWSFEALIPWSVICDGVKQVTNNAIKVSPSDCIATGVTHNAKMIYMDRYKYRDSSMPDYSGQILGYPAQGEICTISRHFTPCDILPGTSTPGSHSNAQQVRSSGIYLHTVDHICKAGDWVITTPASCTARELKERKCVTCGKVMESKTGSFGHVAGEPVVEKEPTCTATGVKKTYCTFCNTQMSSNTIPMLDHTPMENWVIETQPTYFTEGSQYKLCTVCNTEVAREVIPVRPYENKFEDVDTQAWYASSVEYCVKKGYMNGVSDTKFAPATQLTRAGLVQMLFNMEGMKAEDFAGDTGFKDAAEGAWYAAAVKWAGQTGVSSGDGRGNFSPTTVLTREQLAQFLMNYASLKGYNVETRTSLMKFTDRTSIAVWAYEGVSWAVANGLISGTGDGTVLSPKNPATRAAAAKILQSFDESFSA